jgi:hypothetical protein
MAAWSTEHKILRDEFQNKFKFYPFSTNWIKIGISFFFVGRLMQAATSNV